MVFVVSSGQNEISPLLAPPEKIFPTPILVAVVSTSKLKPVCG